MVTLLRRRLQGEAGISLVEMMIALLVLTVAMFALLGGLIASATSVVDQQLRAEATRVATQTLEGARFAAYDDLDIGTDTQTVTTANGREMAVEQTVAYMDAFNPMIGTNEDVKFVTVVVSWSDRGRDREVTYTTAIAPPDPELVSTQVLVTSLDPGAREVDADGEPVEAVTLTATPQGFSFLGNMTARWTRQDGTLANKQLTQVPSTDTWEVELTADDITWTLDFGDSVEIEIRVVAGGNEGVAMLTLFRPEDTAPGPTLTAETVAPDPIVVVRPSGQSSNCNGNRCKNDHAVQLSVQVVPYDDDQVIEAVYVEYDLRAATSPVEVPLVFDEDEGAWGVSYVPHTVEFAPGSSQPFNFFALYDGGQRSATATVLREVREE